MARTFCSWRRKASQRVLRKQKPVLHQKRTSTLGERRLGNAHLENVCVVFHVHTVVSEFYKAVGSSSEFRKRSELKKHNSGKSFPDTFAPS